MKITVINPNTSQSMTDHINRELAKIKREDTELEVTCPDRGPITIESAYDEAYAVPPTLELVQEANRKGQDAVILACFSDPGINAAKEISDIPVVGIEESTLHVASMLGNKFTILTTLKERVAAKENEVEECGLTSKLASVRPLEMTVAETDEEPERAQERIFEVAKKAIEEDGAEVFALGCAGMAGYAEPVEEKLGTVVLDPSSVALKITESIVDANLNQSKVGLFATPPEKEFKGYDL
ncbi:aspartate/glutamate racemase family protein [Candidatus Bipolaricaulota bacterium]|nr:aspartate/glutamate racemase family protein [Candidatus Bipolaricaulota bacterium]